MKKLCIILSSFALVAVAAAQDTANLKFVGTGKGRSDIRITFDGKSQNVFAGQLKHSFTGGVGSLEWLNGKTVNTFCSEPTQYVTAKGSRYTRVDVPQLDPSVWSVNGQAKKTAIERLFAGAYSGAASATANSSMAAAFQIAVWKIGYDFDGSAGSLDINAGRFRAGMNSGAQLSAEISSNLTNLLDFSIRSYPVGGPSNVIALHDDCNQDQITAVPEPASLAVIGLGLAGLIRRKTKKA